MPADEDLGSPTSPDNDGPPSTKRRSSAGLAINGCDDMELNNESNCTIDSTLNSECNITVIHVTLPPTKDGDEEGTTTTPLAENDKKDYTGEGKDSKDGSDSGVEGCAVEPLRVGVDFKRAGFLSFRDRK